jgi:hypothetical protein
MTQKRDKDTKSERIRMKNDKKLLKDMILFNLNLEIGFGKTRKNIIFLFNT